MLNICSRVSKAKPHFERLMIARLSPTSAITTMDYKVVITIITTITTMEYKVPLQSLQTLLPWNIRSHYNHYKHYNHGLQGCQTQSVLILGLKVCDLQRRLNKLQSRTKEKRRWNWENKKKPSTPHLKINPQKTVKINQHLFRIKDIKKQKVKAWCEPILTSLYIWRYLTVLKSELQDGGVIVRWAIQNLNSPTLSQNIMTQSLNSANIDTEKKTEKYSKPKNVSLVLQIFIVLKGHPGIPGKEEEINHHLFLEDKKRKQQKNQKILFSRPARWER